MNNLYYNKILDAATHRKFDILKEIKQNLSNEVNSLDDFFEEFLVKNNLDRKKKIVNNWKIYRDKTDEYCEVVDNLKLVKYYLEKFHV
jgi:hypothetical protein